MLHKYRLSGMNIVIDVNSGAVHVLDDVAFKILDYYDNDTNGLIYDKEEISQKLSSIYNINEIEEAYKELMYLKENELLFTGDYYEEYASKLNKDSVVKALCLHIAHDCNLRCEYCFGSTGSYHGDRSLMSEEVGKKSIDFVIENSGKRRNIEIDFFGGEPLMNFDVVKKIVEYAKEEGKKRNKNFRFTITTNGLLLDEDIKEYVNQNMGNIVLSIDGRKEVNDKMRYRVDGTGSYDTIIPKYIDMAESRHQDNYYVRGTFTKNNLDFYNDVIHLADIGFKQISVEPVVALKTEKYSIQKDDIPRIFEEYEKLAEEIIKRKLNGKNTFNFFHFMIDLSQGPCIIKRLSGCGAGHEYLAVTPQGDIYPCHQLVGIDEFKIGDVFSNELNNNIVDLFRKSNVYTKKECKKCWAKFYCSGGCAANSYQFNNDINVPYEIACELEKKRIECAIMIQAKLLS